MECHSLSANVSSDDSQSQVSSSWSRNSSQLIKSNKRVFASYHFGQETTYKPSSMTITPVLGHSSSAIHCLRFKYFITFFVCSACMALLATSLLTPKWLISNPVRILKSHNGQVFDGDLAADLLTAIQNERPTSPLADKKRHDQIATSSSSGANLPRASNFPLGVHDEADSGPKSSDLTSKFQGKIHFGLFNGLKVLDYGFGARVNQLSIAQAFVRPDGDRSQSTKNELISFKSWLLTLSSVVVAMSFALVGAIFAIINFVIVPRGTVTGPVGLVTWNVIACTSCLLAIFSWLLEYLTRLKWNVLSLDEVQNGWTSEDRSRFGYSFYFVCAAAFLHLVNILIVTLVQTETWTSNGKGKEAKNQNSICDGVIMLY